jgi:putative hemolysin
MDPVPLSFIIIIVIAVLAVAAGFYWYFRKKNKNEYAEEDIISMVAESQEQGNILASEAEMIQNIFEFDDKQAQDIMTHRSQITAIEGSTRLDDAIRFMADAPNSRFPVYEGNIDNITGALYLKDAMRFHMQETYNIWYIKDIPDLLREVKFIPETRRIDDLFRSMQKTQVQMAIVVDEYGETSGLVTMEDILEEIVGNIFDEYDRQEKMIIPAWEGSWKLNGMLSPEEAGEALGTVFPEDFDTLSGYLTAKLNHIPGEEDRSAVIEDPDTGYRFRILSLEGSMIQWAQAERLSPREEEG